MAGEVMASGPIFDGRAIAAAEAFGHHVESEIARQAAEEIKNYLPTQYKYLGHSGGNPKDNPVPQDAGYYQSQVHAEASGEEYRVTDSDVVYGPWLEGESERNNAYRFPGYNAFRKAQQEADAKALEQAETLLTPYIAIMNGV